MSTAPLPPVSVVTSHPSASLIPSFIVGAKKEYQPAIAVWTRESSETDRRMAVLFALAKKQTEPLTEKQEGVLERFYSISKTTQKYLGPLGYSIVIVTALIGGLSGVRIASYAGIPEESPAADVIPFTISATVGTVLGVASMIFTGTLPDKKSDAADQVVEVLPEIESQFKEAAMHLLSLVWSHDLHESRQAIEIAARIKENLPLIQAKLKMYLQTTTLDEKIVRYLQVVVDYVCSMGTKKVLLSEIEDRIAFKQYVTGSLIPPCFMAGAAAPLAELAPLSSPAV